MQTRRQREREKGREKGKEGGNEKSMSDEGKMKVKLCLCAFEKKQDKKYKNFILFNGVFVWCCTCVTETRQNYSFISV